MEKTLYSVLFFAAVSMGSGVSANEKNTSPIQCGSNYSVVSGDTLSEIGLRSYGSVIYQPIFKQNIDTIGMDPDLILIDQNLTIPCLTSDASAAKALLPKTDDVAAKKPDQLVFTFNKASAPPFIINSGIIDAYLSQITEVTEGRVSFVDPEFVNRDHAQQYNLVVSGKVDGAYVLNSTIAASHPLLQLPMLPMLGGSAEQTAVSLWKLHEDYLAQTDYFDDAELLGFVAAPAAHIWRETSAPVTHTEGIAQANDYHVPYFHGLDVFGPAAMRTEVAQTISSHKTTYNEPPTFFLAHGAALALGVWNEEANVSVLEVDNGLYTPTFSVVLSNDAWAQISVADQAAIRKISGEALAHRSAAWDEFDNAFRSRMLDNGLDHKKADKAMLNELFVSSISGLNAWISEANGLGVDANEAVNSYLVSLRELEDRLIYRAQDGSLENHPFVTGGFF